MFSKINSFSTRGIDGYRITVEVDVSNGLPSFVMVGDPGGGGAGGAGARSDRTSECGVLPAAEADHGQFIASRGAERGNGV